MTALRILSFNWHEAYLCLLAKTGHTLTVVDKHKGGHAGWLRGTRPVPPNVTLLPVGSEQGAVEMARRGCFDAAICHNMSDLAALHGVAIPRLLVFHNRISTELELFRVAGRPVPTREQYIAQFLSLWDDRTRAVFISPAKQADAPGIHGRVILPGIDLNEFDGYRGDTARVLRVGNFFTGRDLMLGQTVAAAALGDLPVSVLGINPEIPGARLSASFDDLRENFRSHRVYLNTTVDGYEDGYNLSMLEAMATGMPVVTTANRTSPVEEGINGFVSDDPAVLHESLARLLRDHDLALRLGSAARETVARKFPLELFVKNWNEALGEAVQHLGSAHRATRPSSFAVPHEAAAGTIPADQIRRLARSLLLLPRESGISKEVQARLARARILLASGKFDEAEQLFRNGNDADEPDPVAASALGCIALARGDWETAESLYSRALARDPENPNALCGRGLSLLHLGRDMEASDALLRGVARGASDPSMLPPLIRASSAVGRFAEAREAAERFLERDPRHPDLLFSCAVLSARAGDIPGALELLARLESVAPSYPGLASFKAACTGAPSSLGL